MNYYNEIKNKLIDNEVYSRVKDYSKELYKIITYFEIGILLNKASGKYGDNIIDEYFKKLVVEIRRKYNRRTLFRMKQFYNMFKDEKVSLVVTQLTRSHYLLLLSLNNYDEIMYYINISKKNNLNQRQLQERIKSNEYKTNLNDRYNYVDLLLYNINYKCYVVVELKVTELKKEHIGQIMTYVNYIDKNIKTIDENHTVGIIICKQDNEYVI